jgi:hypothetical protein
VLLLTLEEFAENPPAVLTRICSFLGVDPAFQFTQLDTRYNSGDVYEMPTLWVSLMKRLRRIALVAKHMIPRPLFHRLRAQVARLPGRKAELGRYTLTAAERLQVIDRLTDDLRRLQHEYGVATDRYWSIHDGKLANV